MSCSTNSSKLAPRIRPSIRRWRFVTAAAGPGPDCQQDAGSPGEDGQEDCYNEFLHTEFPSVSCAMMQLLRAGSAVRGSRGSCLGLEVNLTLILYLLQFLRTCSITALGSCPSANSTIIFSAMKFTVALWTPSVFRAASSILLAQLAQSTSIL